MGRNRRRTTATATLAAAIGVLLGLPAFALGGLVEDLTRGVERTVDPVVRAVVPKRQVAPQPAAQPRAPAVAPAQTPGGGTYQPPLHGANPHGQGTVATVDLAPSGTRPLVGDPTGAGDAGQDREEVIVGRARGEQGADGKYRGHVTIVSLFGNEILGVDTGEGETANGPLEALQTAVLDELCTGTSICLEVLRADSQTTSTGSSNSFAVARAGIGGAEGLNVGAAESNGNISQDANCQTAHGDSTVANVNAGGNVLANVASSSTSSTACRDGSQTQQNSSQVIGLFGTAVPLPASGCGEGTPDVETGIPTLLPIVCNPDDTNGVGEAVVQATAPYGVREALAIFALDAGGTALLKATTAASESRAAAPAGPDGPTTPEDPTGPGDPEQPTDPTRDDDGDDGDGDGGEPECSDGVDNDGDGQVDFPADPQCSSADDDSEAGGEPECSDGVDNDGDGKVDFPADPQCSSPQDDSESGGEVAGAAAESLPRTGADLLLILALATATLAAGLRLRRAVERWDGQAGS